MSSKKQRLPLEGKYLQDLKELGEVLRNAREYAGMSMRALSAESGVMAYQISDIENAKTGTKTATLHKLFNALNVSIREAYKMREMME